MQNVVLDQQSREIKQQAHTITDNQELKFSNIHLDAKVIRLVFLGFIVQRT